MFYFFYVCVECLSKPTGNCISILLVIIHPLSLLKAGPSIGVVKNVVLKFIINSICFIILLIEFKGQALDILYTIVF